MITVTLADVWRRVIYVAGDYEGAERDTGLITSFNDKYVFVRYDGDLDGTATEPSALYWPGEEPDPR